MRALFALPGLHRHSRGAEVAFIAIASALGKAGHDVTLIGSGQPKNGTPYRFLHAASIPRERFERFPSFPFLRNETAYEELSFGPSLLRSYRPADYDVTLTCSYPYTNWILRRPTSPGPRPPHVFVTENGDWPAFANKSEYCFFGCDGLVCTNPDYFERNKNRWRCRLIPNGVDCDQFRPGVSDPRQFGIPPDRMIVLMVSALVPNKRVDAGIEAVSRIPDAHLVVAGDGPLRRDIEAAAARSLPGRFTLLSVAPVQMPRLYQSANVFLHLCKDESFGNVLIEAMACGLPVVAPDVDRVRWIVGSDEFLVETDDAAAVAYAIVVANGTALDRNTTRLARAAEFSWTKVGSMYEQFLKDVTSSGPARAG
jgi:glycosyltransferase involved in cell wall biosynthesis